MDAVCTVSHGWRVSASFPSCRLNNTDTQFTVCTEEENHVATTSADTRSPSPDWDSLWKKFSREPSKRWHNRNTKVSNSTDLKHRHISDLQWIDCHDNSLQRIVLQPLNPLAAEEAEAETETETETETESEAEAQAEFRVVKKTKKARKAKEIHGRGVHDEDENFSISKTSSKLANSQPRTFVASLKASGKAQELHRGSRLHADIIRMGLLETNVFVGSSLVSMYAKCGLITKAQELFDSLPVRDLVSWSALMAGYAQHGYGEQALQCFARMQIEGLSPNAVVLVCILKACGSVGAADKGREIHAEVVKQGLLETNLLVGNALIDMYVKCGLLAKAQEVFDELPVQGVISWNTLIIGYVQHGCAEQALKCFEWMQFEGLSRNAVTFICILKACGSIGAADKGKQIHADIVREGLLERDVVVGTAVVDMYAKCGLLAQAQEVFDELPVRNVVTWNALITGYAHHGHDKKALECFEQMHDQGVSPNFVTFVSTLKACGNIGAADKGKEIHAWIVREGGLEGNIVIGTTVVGMYAKCGLLAKAQEVFDELPVRDSVSWNALIAGYTQHGHGEQALRCFELMQLEGISPSVVTFVCLLKACGSIGAGDKGKEIHAEIVREELFRKNIIVGNALVGMYAKCGLLAKAQEVFDDLPVRNVVAWSALMAGYSQEGHGEQALKCFDQMQLEGLSPDSVSFVCLLKVCSCIGAVDKGKEIHAEIVRGGFLRNDVLLGTALVDMYAKCGLLTKAQEVFDELPVRNVVSWSVLMAGYALLGKAEHVFYLFARMIGDCVEPNLVAFTIVLNACSHNGLQYKGQMYFEIMTRGYGVVPTLEHYTCMVDLFARAGHLDKAVAMLKKMPFSPDLKIWLTVLGACQKWGNTKLGRLAFQHAVHLDQKEAAAYICMNNIYAATGRQEDADEVEAMRVKKKAWKTPGHSWIDGD